MQDPEALRAMSQWLASLPLELVRRRGAHARLQESVDALLQPSDRTSKYKIKRMLVAWGQGSGRKHERAAAARGRLCATVLRVGGELQRAQNRDRPALKAARAWMREVPESALADSPALKRLRTSLFNVEETLQDIHALAAHGVVCTQPDGRKRPAWHIEADLCDSLEAAVLHQKKLRGAEQPAQAQEDGVLGQEATAAGPCSGQEDPLVRVQRLHGMELLNADSWLQARTPADPDAESLQRDVREVLTYLGCPGTEGPLHLRVVTAGRNVEEMAQMLLRAVSLRQRRWRALQSPLTPALRQDDREMPAFSAGFRLTGRRWALGQAALRVFLLERGVAMEEVAMKACMGLVDNLRKGNAGHDESAERVLGIQRQRMVEGKIGAARQPRGRINSTRFVFTTFGMGCLQSNKVRFMGTSAISWNPRAELHSLRACVARTLCMPRCERTVKALSARISGQVGLTCSLALRHGYPCACWPAWNCRRRHWSRCLWPMRTSSKIFVRVGEQEGPGSLSRRKACRRSF